MSTAMIAITASSSTSVKPPRRNEVVMSSVGHPNQIIIVRVPGTESMIEIRPLLTEIQRGSVHPPAVARGLVSSLRLAPGSRP